MVTKTRNLITVIIHGIICVLYFIPGFFNCTFMNNTSRGHWSTSWSEYLSLCGSLNHGYAAQIHFGIFGWLALVIAAITMVLLVLQLLAKDKKQNSVLCAYGPCAETLFVCVYALLTAVFGSSYFDAEKDYFKYPLGFLFFIIVALLVALCILSIVTYKEYKKNGIVEATEKMPAKPTTSMELAEYHKLLESGVITEEEFNAKKKQLLGL